MRRCIVGRWWMSEFDVQCVIIKRCQYKWYFANRSYIQQSCSVEIICSLTVNFVLFCRPALLCRFNIPAVCYYWTHLWRCVDCLCSSVWRWLSGKWEAECRKEGRQYHGARETHCRCTRCEHLPVTITSYFSNSNDGHHLSYVHKVEYFPQW